MKFLQSFLIGFVPLSHAADTIVGVYLFSRHGDRTPKILAPTNLTDLGYAEVFQSGSFYHDRYIAADSATHIMGISPDLVNYAQIAASAPLDDVLQNSAQGFLQGLYPPVGDAMGSMVLANGTNVTAPMHGYQLIPVNLVESGSSSESSGWLQDATGCYNAEVSSNNYFHSAEYNKLLASTMTFYKNLLPAIEPEFNSTTATYENAYTIFDYLNVARIHNATFAGSNLVTPEVFGQLRDLANVHEFDLAYNSSEPIRAIAGAQLAAEIVDFFEETIATPGESLMGIQFGSYGTFLSFFGLAQLPKASTSFTGVVNYAGSMVFELYTSEAITGAFPSEDQLMVRFYFHNGTTTSTSQLQMYPLFGQSQLSMSWSAFKMQMGKFSIGSTPAWCHACGNTTGACEPYSPKAQELRSASSGSGGLSNAVAGVIGAMVTLAVILMLGILIFFVAGLTLVRKKRLASGRSVANGGKGQA